MWIFLNDAFFSVVAHDPKMDKTNSDPKSMQRRYPDIYLCVRARFEGDIEKWFPDSAVTHTPKADYAYRAVILRSEFDNVLAGYIGSMRYTNFKGSAEDDQRHNTYLKVWRVLASAQDQQQDTLKTSLVGDKPALEEWQKRAYELLTPTKPGFYWAKWKIAAEGTKEGNELTPCNEWEIVQVDLNCLDPSDPKYLSVAVCGVEKTQWLENFFWGPGPVTPPIDK